MTAATLSPEQLAQYRVRVGLGSLPEADLAGLAAIQAAHQRGIGFENLDIRLGRGIAIESEAVFDKLITRGRGGYCFEKNRLLADVLASLGMEVRPLLARVLLRHSPDEPAPPLSHVCLFVQVEGRAVITDAGFGGSATPLMLLKHDFEALAPDGARHRLRRIGEAGALPGEWLLERAAPQDHAEGEATAWHPQYAFGLQPVAPADLAMANHWTSTRAGTRFTSGHIVSIALEDGFASLTERALCVTSVSGQEERTVDDPADYARTLRDIFRIALSEEEAAALPLFSQEPVSAP